MATPTKYVIKCFKGYWRKNGNTAFPMIPNNWVSDLKKVKDIAQLDFQEASILIQIHLRGKGCEIVAFD